MDDFTGSDSDGDEGGLLGGLRRAGAGPGIRGPVLGEDLLELLARRRAPAQLLRSQQLDLNDEAHLGDLEDPALAEHMRAAREARDLAAAAARRAAADLAAAERSDVAVRRAMSALMTGLTEQLMAVQCACDDILTQATSVGLLADNRVPYGYPKARGGGAPPTADMVAALGHLKTKLGGVGQSLADSAAGLVALERHLTLARREHEALAEALRRWGAAASGERPEDDVDG